MPVCPYPKILVVRVAGRGLVGTFRELNVPVIL